jgi:hypothetical protein
MNHTKPVTLMDVTSLSELQEFKKHRGLHHLLTKEVMALTITDFTQLSKSEIYCTLDQSIANELVVRLNNARAEKKYFNQVEKSVLIYVGPARSGKTTNMKKLAEMRGLMFNPVQWHYLKSSPQSYWRFQNHDEELIAYLFIDEYDLADAEANLYLHELSLMGIMVVAASQTEITSHITESLPPSFRVTRCTLNPTIKSKIPSGTTNSSSPVGGKRLKSSLSGDEKKLATGARQLPRDNERREDIV